MRHREGIHHETIGQPAETGSEVGVVLLLARIEPEVLQEYHLAGRQGVDLFFNSGPDTVVQALDRMPQ